MPTDRQQIDRLVDGELDEHERRELIESFDHDPDGWRRCAAAFLENQEFAAAVSLTNVADGPSVERQSRNERGSGTLSRNLESKTGLDSRLDTVARQRGRTAHLAWAIAIAACLVVGIVIDRGIRSGRAVPWEPGIWSSGVGGPQRVSPSSVASPSSLDNEFDVVSQVVQSNTTVATPVGLSPKPVAVSTDVLNTAAESLVLEAQYSAIPNDIEEILHRLGHRVERRRFYVPVATSNGAARMPVEEIEIVTADGQTY